MSKSEDIKDQASKVAKPKGPKVSILERLKAHDAAVRAAGKPDAKTTPRP